MKEQTKCVVGRAGDGYSVYMTAEVCRKCNITSAWELEQLGGWRSGQVLHNVW